VTPRSFVLVARCRHGWDWCLGRISSGGKERFGGISKRGDGYLRSLLVVGSLAVIKHAQRHGTERPWLVKLLERRTSKIAAVAIRRAMIGPLRTFNPT
jgi:transposase